MLVRSRAGSIPDRVVQAREKFGVGLRLWALCARGLMQSMRIAGPENAKSPEPTSERPAAPAGPVGAPTTLDAATVLSLQRTAGNAAVSAMINRAAQQRAVSRAPTIAPPGGGESEAKAPSPRQYDFEATVYGKPTHYRNLTAEQVIAKLRMLWRFCHDDLDAGRKENLRLVDLHKEDRTAAFWSDVAGRAALPDPEMWNEVGRGALSDVRSVLDSTEATLKARWQVDEANTDRNLPPEVARLPMMQAALAFDPTLERIKYATACLTRAASDLAERQRRLDDYVGDRTRARSG